MKKYRIEGLLIQKVPYKERDIIGKLLLRSGKLISVYFYGGRGGGKNKKSSILEIGHCLWVELRPNKKSHASLWMAKEWGPIWRHEKIRLNHHAFYTMCFFLELISKVTQNVDEGLDDFGQEDMGLFRALSNALFVLEKENDTVRPLFIFMAKFLFELGVAPNLSHCVFCEKELTPMGRVSLENGEGGFSCGACEGSSKSNERRLYDELRFVQGLSWRDSNKAEGFSRDRSVRLFQYFCHQFEFGIGDFVSFPMIS